MNNKPRVVLYLRLSKEDLEKLTKEEKSESIKNQEIMLKSYAKENGWRIVGIYDDEDYSGSDRNRPNFNRMIHECEIGNVDIVLVKTQARFARDIELIDKYIHNKFREWNVRFVTYLERIDNTRYETKKTSQIIAMKDEWMLEDTSLNIRETFRSKRLKGQFTGSFAPYGYKKDSKNKNHLIVDQVAALNVARIFKEYSIGYGMDKIASNLTKDRILSPLEYKIMNGINLKTPFMKKSVSDCINHAGSFIVSCRYTNNENVILKNLTTIEILSNDEKFTDKFLIKLKDVKNDMLNIYYSKKQLDELDIKVIDGKYVYENNFDFSDGNWVRIDVGDVVPSFITCLATNIKELDRTHDVYYSFEVTLRENKNHLKYYYKIYPNVDNINITPEYRTYIRTMYQWSSSTIRKILKDEVYIGNLVQFKTTTVSYKNHTIIYNDSDAQIRVLNTHEPIIDDNLWIKVQNRLKESTKCCKLGKVHLFANKIYCESCHKVFYKCGKVNKDGYGYLCCKDKITGWANCNNKKWINELELHNYIKDKINHLLELFYDEKMLIEIDNDIVENDLFSEILTKLTEEREKIGNEIICNSSYFQGLYEDFKCGLIDKEQFLLLKDKYSNDNVMLKERVEVINGKLSSIKSLRENLKNKRELFHKYRHIDSLNSYIVNDFIDKIVIGSYNSDDNSRSINIIWNFEDN